MAKKYSQLSENALSKTGAALGFILWVVGLFWHGMMGQPSMMGFMYNTSFMMPSMIIGSLVLLVVGGYIIGWLIATLYNYFIK